MGNEAKGVLCTILYADIFAYPLTFDQIQRFLIGKHALGKNSIRKAVDALQPFLVEKNGYIALKEKKRSIQERISKKKDNEKKIQVAKKISVVLALIPPVRFIGISGSLAMENAAAKDDIDFFIITAPETLWTTRLCLLFLLTLLGKRRRRRGNISNKICLNMFMDGKYLELPKNRQNLYTAHEIVQIIPLINKRKTYEAFLEANSWVREFLPNIRIKKRGKTKKNTSVPIFLEYGAKMFQLFFIRKHHTSEIVSNTLLAFHPDDYTMKVLEEYNKRLQKYGLL